jgi:hypothetical protein
LPFLIVHNVLPARAWSEELAIPLSRKLRFPAGASLLSPESGNDDSIGTKPAVVAMVVTEPVMTVTTFVFEIMDVTVTTLLRRQSYASDKDTMLQHR